ncbi:MAG: hypothetical protein WC869_11985 [Phycisphaerae bacterium]
MTETIGRALRGAPSLSQLKVSEKTSLVRDADGLYVVTEQPLGALLDDNKAWRAERQNLRGTERHRVKIAEIPDTLFFELRRRFGSPKNNPADWKRWLNDPDNRYFRTWEGHV